MRDHYTHEEREAAHTLDLVRAGVNVPQHQIMRALWVLGDGVGL